jgi:PKHD-type hydroxylase
MVIFNKDFPNLFNYFIFNDPFSNKNINLIHNLIIPLPSQEGKAEFENDTEGRESIIKWIPLQPQSYGLYNILKEYITTSNSQLWNFNISFSDDQIQYTEYSSNNKGKYDWHIDGFGGTSRKLSLVIQLSDPSEYEGGDLQIRDYYNEGQIITIPKQIGLVIVFPSYLWHRVTPVTKGIRKSLVWWVGGEPFK